MKFGVLVISSSHLCRAWLYVVVYRVNGYDESKPVT